MPTSLWPHAPIPSPSSSDKPSAFRLARLKLLRVRPLFLMPSAIRNSSPPCPFMMFCILRLGFLRMGGWWRRPTTDPPSSPSSLPSASLFPRSVVSWVSVSSQLVVAVPRICSLGCPLRFYSLAQDFFEGLGYCARLAHVPAESPDSPYSRVVVFCQRWINFDCAKLVLCSKKLVLTFFSN